MPEPDRIRPFRQKSALATGFGSGTAQRQPDSPTTRASRRARPGRLPRRMGRGIWDLVLLFQEYARADHRAEGRTFDHLRGDQRPGVPLEDAREDVHPAHHGCKRRELSTHGASTAGTTAAREPADRRGDHLGPDGRGHHGRALVPGLGRARAGPLPPVLRRVRPGAVSTGGSLRIAQIDARPKHPRQIMRRATMPVVSKEGEWIWALNWWHARCARARCGRSWKQA